MCDYDFSFVTSYYTSVLIAVDDMARMKLSIILTVLYHQQDRQMSYIKTMSFPSLYCLHVCFGEIATLWGYGLAWLCN